MTTAVIATTPQGMIEAQGTVRKWIDARVDHWNQTMAEAETLYNSLKKASMPTRPAGTQMLKARKHLDFYAKVRAALAAGYVIIPPFDVQVFAIRTDADSPKENRSEVRDQYEQSVKRLPLSKGKFVNPMPPRLNVDTIERPNHNNTAMVKHAVYENGDWKDVELPIRALKPEVIEATAQALGERIFDALGIAPSYRSADPIIVGQIMRPGRFSSPLTFFVAWWLDSREI